MCVCVRGKVGLVGQQQSSKWTGQGRSGPARGGAATPSMSDSYNGSEPLVLGIAVAAVAGLCKSERGGWGGSAIWSFFQVSPPRRYHSTVWAPPCPVLVDGLPRGSTIKDMHANPLISLASPTPLRFTILPSVPLALAGNSVSPMKLLATCDE